MADSLRGSATASSHLPRASAVVASLGLGPPSRSARQGADRAPDPRPRTGARRRPPRGRGLPRAVARAPGCQGQPRAHQRRLDLAGTGRGVAPAVSGTWRAADVLRRRPTCSTPSRPDCRHREEDRVGETHPVGLCPRPGACAAHQGCFGAPDRSWARVNPARRPRGAHRADHPGRPRVAAALDQQERPQARRRAAAAGPRGQPSDGGRAAPRDGLQPPGEPQDARGHRPPGPQRPVPAHQRGGPAAALPGRAGDLGGHQEEGAGGAVQERRQGAAPQGRPGAGAWCTTSSSTRAGPGEPLRGLRPGRTRPG